MYCTRMDRVKDSIHPQSIKQILRGAMWVAGQFDIRQRCDLFNLKGTVLAETRYGGERDEEIIRAASYASRSLIYLAVENDHLTIEPFKSADAKVSVLQENRGRDGTRIDAFDESRRSRNLVHATRRRVQVFTEGRAHQAVQRSLALRGKVPHRGFKGRWYCHCKFRHVSFSIHAFCSSAFVSCPERARAHPRIRVSLRRRCSFISPGSA